MWRFSGQCFIRLTLLDNTVFAPSLPKTPGNKVANAGWVFLPVQLTLGNLLKQF